jgi:protein-L-isoaspartate(D-aspartate) O-methyltransferase
MVRVDIAGRGVRDPAVLRAMREVPRETFVPEGLREEAFADHPLPIGRGQTISQPYIVAAMTEALALRPGDTVLEIGTGSGYQAAVLAALVRHVYTMEALPELAAAAAERLARLGAANVTVRAGDGFDGWPEHAPYDGIVVTAAPEEVPAALVEQLRAGGRLCVPVGPVHGIQELLLVEKSDAGRVSTRRLMPVRFVPMVRVRGGGA